MLNNYDIKIKLIKWFDFKINLELILKGSIDGFSNDIFHEKADNKGPTLLIFKSTIGNLFGGYAEQSWNKNGGWIKGKGKSFLFSINENKKMACKINNYELYGKYNYGPSFGYSDLYISNNCN